MGIRQWSRREMLGASTGATAGVVFAEPVNAAISPSAVTPELIEAARKEGKPGLHTGPGVNPACRYVLYGVSRVRSLS